MAKTGQRISGVHIPLRLDTTNVERDLEKLNSTLGSVFKSIQGKTENLLSMKKLGEGLIDINRAFGNLRDSAIALQKVEIGSAMMNGIKGLQPELKAIAESFGGTIKQQKEFIAKVSETQAINTQINALKKLEQAGYSTAESLAMLKKRKIEVSQEALTIAAPNFVNIETATKNLRKKLEDEFRGMSLGAGIDVKKLKPEMAGFIDSGVVKNQIESFKQVYDTANKTTEQIYELVKANKLLGNEEYVKAFNLQLSKTGSLLSKSEVDARDLVKALSGIGVSLPKDAVDKVLRSGQVSEQVSLLKQMGEMLKWNTAQYNEQAKAIGLTDSEIKDGLGTLVQYKEIVSKTADEFRKMMSGAGLKPDEKTFSAFTRFRDMSARAEDIKKVGEFSGYSAEQFEKQGRAVGMTTAELERYGLIIQQLTPQQQQLKEIQESFGKIFEKTGLDKTYKEGMLKEFTSHELMKQEYDAIMKTASAWVQAGNEAREYFVLLGKSSTYDYMNKPVIPKIKDLTGNNERFDAFKDKMYTAGISLPFEEATRMYKQYDQALRDSAAVSTLKDLGTALGWTTEKLRAEAEAAGYTAQMLEKLGVQTKTLSGQSSEYAKYKELAYTSGVMREGDFTKGNEIARSEAATEALMQQAKAYDWLQKELLEAAQAGGYTAKEFERLGLATKTITVERAASELQKMAPGAKFTAGAMDELAQKYQKLFNLNQRVGEFSATVKMLELEGHEVKKLAREYGLTTEEFKKFQQMQAKASSGRGIAGVLTPSNLSAGVQSSMAAFGVIGGMYGVAELGKSAFQTSMKLENIDLAFKSIYGSASRASAELQFVRNVSDELGLSFMDTAEGAKKLFAAAKGNKDIEKSAEEIFKSFSQMGAALKLTGHDMNGVFLAISQMISKGKISAEELRLQLGERMPGAVQMLATSMGKTTQELDKMLETGQVGLEYLVGFAKEVSKTYAVGAAGASKGLQAEINRLGNSWMDLKTAFVNTSATAGLVRNITGLVDVIKSFAPAIATAANALFAFGGAFALFKVAPMIIGAVATALQMLSVNASFAWAAVAGGKTIFVGITAALAAISIPATTVVAALAGIGAVIYSMSSSVSESEKVLDKYKDSLINFEKSAESANNGIKSFDVTTATRQIEILTMNLQSLASDMKNVLAIDFNKMASKLSIDSPYADISGFTTWDGDAGLSEFQIKANAEIERMKEGFGKFKIDVQLADGADEQYKLVKTQVDSLTESIQFLKATKAFDDKELTSLVNTRNALAEINKRLEDTAKQMVAVREAQRDLNKEGLGDVDYSKFSGAFEGVRKAIPGTKFEKEFTIPKTADDVASSLKAMATQVAIVESKFKTSNETTSQGEKILKEYNIALEIAAQYAFNTAGGIDSITSSLENAEGGLTILDALKAKLKDVSQVSFDNILAGFDLQVIEAKASKGVKNVVSGLVKQLKPEQSSLAEADKIDIYKALSDSSRINYAVLNKYTNLSEQEIDKLVKKGQETASALDTITGAKGARSGESQIENTIRETTKKIEEWKAKMADSKEDSFAAKLTADIERLDKQLSEGRGTSAQRARLEELRGEMQRTGEETRKFIAQQERFKEMKDYEKFSSGLTKDYMKTTGAEGEAAIAAAREHYNVQLEVLKGFYDKKVITTEQYEQNIAMLRAVFRDQELHNSIDLYDQILVNIEDFYNKYSNISKDFGGVVTSAMEAAGNAIGAFAASGARNFADLGKSFSKLAEDMLSQTARLLGNQLISSLLKMGTRLFFGDSSSAFSLSPENMDFTSGIFGSAKGNVFASGLSSFSGAVVSTPTLFNASSHISKYAKGAGLMGEAGPEAIMPLKRGADGNLGVRAQISSNGFHGINQKISFTSTIINNAGVEVEERRSQDDNGNIDIFYELSKKQAADMRNPGSPQYKVLTKNFGASQVLSRRG